MTAAIGAGAAGSSGGGGSYGQGGGGNCHYDPYGNYHCR